MEMDRSFLRAIAFSQRLRDRWQTRPAHGWRRKRRVWLVWAAPLVLASLLLVAIVIVSVDGARGPWAAFDHELAFTAIMLALATVLGLWILAFRALLTPLYHLRNWAARVRGGNLAARIPCDTVAGEFAELVADVNTFSETLSVLTQERTGRGSQPITARWLAILNDITAGIASSQDLDELLPRFLYTLRRANEIRAGIVRLNTDDGHLRLAASVGLPDDIVAKERRIALDCCLCGRAVGQRAM
ncbi:MAG: HAMP domain-containing protein, partial [Acidiferrobacter sp.]